MSAYKENTHRNRNILNVLIADDSGTERAHLKHILESAGYQVKTATSGGDVLALVKDEAPDLILLDIIMEGGDGYQTCRTLKRNPETANIPVVMVSSKSNAVDVKWAKKLGAIDYIIKPYNEEDLLRRLGEL